MWALVLYSLWQNLISACRVASQCASFMVCSSDILSSLLRCWCLALRPLVLFLLWQNLRVMYHWSACREASQCASFMVWSSYVLSLLLQPWHNLMSLTNVTVVSVPCMWPRVLYSPVSVPCMWPLLIYSPVSEPCMWPLLIYSLWQNVSAESPEASLLAHVELLMKQQWSTDHLYPKAGLNGLTLLHLASAQGYAKLISALIRWR